MKTRLLILIQVTLLAGLSLNAQTEVEVPEPQLSLVNGKVRIDYILQNSTADQKFNIRIEVVTESGTSIVPESLSGDVGPGIAGGNIRSIIWDIETDNIFLDEEIYIQVIALPEAPPVVVPPPVEDTPLQEVVVDEKQEDIPTETKTDQPEAEQAGTDENQAVIKTEEIKSFSRAGLVFQSVLFPGLGLSRLKGKPHWLKGVAAYGCLGGGIYMNRMAYNSYQDYLGAGNPSDADDLYRQSETQNTISQTLIYSAVGIWVIDLVWTIAGSSDLERKSALHRRGFHIDPDLEPLSYAPMLTLSYRF